MYLPSKKNPTSDKPTANALKSNVHLYSEESLIVKMLVWIIESFSNVLFRVLCPLEGAPAHLVEPAEWGHVIARINSCLNFRNELIDSANEYLEDSL